MDEDAPLLDLLWRLLADKGVARDECSLLRSENPEGYTIRGRASPTRQFVCLDDLQDAANGDAGKRDAVRQAVRAWETAHRNATGRARP